MIADRMDIVKQIARPMFGQGAEVLYVSECCGRLYVGLDRPVRCGSDPSHVFDVKELRPSDL